MPVSPCLAAGYTASPARASSPTTDVIAINRPPPWRTMRSAANLASSMPATRSVSISSRISAGLVSR
ncbi:hypothetical protein G6F64_015604 [Rhizopus arrhizus]|uniref:Uncharacterized protein n=1 Tax=Rhizopus oryzae TaxID=64495 RepID=A0A9P7BGF7_RHIOR|nr:hypothetical protein G6F64_015604 [Rhizopus arrhizus]